MKTPHYIHQLVFNLKLSDGFAIHEQEEFITAFIHAMQRVATYSKEERYSQDETIENVLDCWAQHGLAATNQLLELVNTIPADYDYKNTGTYTVNQLVYKNLVDKHNLPSLLEWTISSQHFITNAYHKHTFYSVLQGMIEKHIKHTGLVGNIFELLWKHNPTDDSTDKARLLLITEELMTDPPAVSFLTMIALYSINRIKNIPERFYTQSSFGQFCENVCQLVVSTFFLLIEIELTNLFEKYETAPSNALLTFESLVHVALKKRIETDKPFRHAMFCRIIDEEARNAAAPD